MVSWSNVSSKDQIAFKLQISLVPILIQSKCLYQFHSPVFNFKKKIPILQLYVSLSDWHIVASVWNIFPIIWKLFFGSKLIPSSLSLYQKDIGQTLKIEYFSNSAKCDKNTNQNSPNQSFFFLKKKIKISSVLFFCSCLCCHRVNTQKHLFFLTGHLSSFELYLCREYSILSSLKAKTMLLFVLQTPLYLKSLYIITKNSLKVYLQ